LTLQACSVNNAAKLVHIRRTALLIPIDLFAFW